jgi:hypothetical protein
MASLTHKMIKGHKYYYARVYKRVNGKPKIVHLEGVSGDGNEPNSQVLKYDYQSFNYYLTITYGVAYQKMFRLLCELVWHLELSVFYLLKKSCLVNKKYKLLKWMLSE